jgi:hypothetical protein
VFLPILDFIVYFHLWNGGGLNFQKEFSDFSSEEDGSWQLVSKKKLSYANAIKKPGVILIGTNAIEIKNKKVWRPRISIFDRLGNSQRSIPRKPVFDRLHSKLKVVHQARNKGAQFENFQTSVRNQARASQRTIYGRSSHQDLRGSIISNRFDQFYSGSHFCAHCLKLGHLRANCRSLVHCLSCNQAGHYAAACPVSGLGVEMGFKPKQPLVDYFHGKAPDKGKDIDVFGWFKERRGHHHRLAFNLLRILGRLCILKTLFTPTHWLLRILTLSCFMKF